MPKYRFSQFSDPWQKTTLDQFLTVFPGRNKVGLFSKNDVLSVSGELGVVNQIELLGRSYAGESVLPYHIVRNGHIVYTKSPLLEYPYGIIKENRGPDGIVSTLYAVYSVNSNCFGTFVEHYFSYRPRINNYLRPIVRIGAKHDMKIGNQEVLENYVTFPSVDEQKKISSFLTTIDDRILIQKERIEHLEKRKIGLLKKVFSQEIVFKNKEGNPFKPWKKCVIKDLYSKGKAGGTPKASDASFYGDYIPFLSISDISQSGKYIYKTEKGLSEKGLNNCSAWRVPADSIILSMYASYGKVCINKIPLATSQALFSMIIDEKMCTLDFAFTLFESLDLTGEWRTLIQTGTQPNLSKELIEPVEIKVPSLEEQEVIASFFAAIDNQLLYEKEKLSRMKSIKQGFLKGLFD